MGWIPKVAPWAGALPLVCVLAPPPPPRAGRAGSHCPQPVVPGPEVTSGHAVRGLPATTRAVPKAISVTGAPGMVKGLRAKVTLKEKGEQRRRGVCLSGTGRMQGSRIDFPAARGCGNGRTFSRYPAEGRGGGQAATAGHRPGRPREHSSEGPTLGAGEVGLGGLQPGVPPEAGQGPGQGRGFAYLELTRPRRASMWPPLWPPRGRRVLQPGRRCDQCHFTSFSKAFGSGIHGKQRRG